MKVIGNYMAKTLLGALGCSLLSLLVACGPTLPPSDVTLYAYYERFIDEANSRHVILKETEIALVFGHTTSIPKDVMIVATCQRDKRLITVDQEYWESASDTEREIVIMHESGHCSAELPHNNSHKAIMNSYLLDSEYYNEHRIELLDELFSTLDKWE